jgi:prevent-host-death family protein
MKWKAKSKKWPLQDAKAKFSQVVDLALTEGPQYVTRRGKDAVVILTASEYEKLTGPGQQPSIVDVFLKFPKGTGFKWPERDQKDVGREPPTFH